MRDGILTGTKWRNSINTKLIDYGIQNESSDIRVHVCPNAQRVYVYPTIFGLQTIDDGDYPLVNGYQKGFDFATAKGYLVPPFNIPKCASITMHPRVWTHMAFSLSDTTTAKGQKATDLVLGMLKNGLLPIPALGQEIKEFDIQVKGQDIIIKSSAITQDDIRIQVKCDYRGGEKCFGGTGNLFLQIQECNPGQYH